MPVVIATPVEPELVARLRERGRTPRRPLRARPAAAASIPVGPPRRPRLRAVAGGAGTIPPAGRAAPRFSTGSPATRRQGSPGRSAPRPGSASSRRPSAGAGEQVRAAHLTATELDRVAIASASGVHAVPLAEWSLLGLLAFTKGLPRLEPRRSSATLGPLPRRRAPRAHAARARRRRDRRRGRPPGIARSACGCSA